MKNIFQLLMSVFITLCLLSIVGAQRTRPAEEKKLDGKTIFLEKKCNSCHSIEALGITKKGPPSKTNPPDLSTVGSEVNAEFITKWLRWKESIKGKKHLLPFSGKDEELKVLAEWLASLKSEGKH